MRLLLALSLLTGCAMAPSGSGTGEPVFCVATVLGTGGPLTSSMVANSWPRWKHLRDLRILSAASSSAEGCDVLLTISEGIAETEPEAVRLSQQTGRQADCSIAAFSARTKQLIRKEIACSPDCEVLPSNLQKTFQPDQPAYKLIGAPAGRGEQL